jgi:Protein of unknown function (DUF1552)
MKKEFSRREIIKLGSFSVFAQGLYSQLVSQAFASPLQRPRLVIYMTGNALESRFVNRITTQQGQNGSTVFNFGEAFSPLKEIENNVLLVKNLYNNISRNLHGMGFSSLTCAKNAEGQNEVEGVPGGASIDQFLIREMKLQEAFPSLALGIREGKAGVKECLASGRGQIVTSEFNPAKAFERLFGSTINTNEINSAQSATAAELERQKLLRLARKKKILDRVTDDIARLNKILAPSEREKLEQYLGSLESIEKKITQEQMNIPGNTAPKNNCKIPNKPPSTANLEVIDFVAPTNLNLALAAFSCGLARSATFLHARGAQHQGYRAAAIPGLTKNMNHHEEGCHEKLEEVKFIYQWHANQILSFYKGLKAIPEGNGSMADNTIIVWFSDCGGEHHTGNDNVPFVVIAPTNGPLRVNKFLDFKPKTVSTTKFWVSISHAMGIPISTFGDGTDPSGGPIPEIMT